MIILFSSSSIDYVKSFYKYLNSRHENMTFTYEGEQNNCLSFLDVLITREGNGLSTSLSLSTGNLLLVGCTLTSIAIFPISTRKD